MNQYEFGALPDQSRKTTKAYVSVAPVNTERLIVADTQDMPSAQQSQAEVPSAHTQIIMKENLETPAESVEFLEYFHSHSKRVDTLQLRLKMISKFCIALGCLGLLFLSYNVFHATAESKMQARHPMLKSGHGSNGLEDMSTTLNAISAMLWGLVVIKAKQGLTASDSKDPETVGTMLRKAGKLIILICMSSMLKFVAEMSANVPAVQVQVPAHKRLQATHITTEVHPDSYYDPSSSHYMGGAHNVAMAHLTGEPLPTKNTHKGTPSQKFNAQASAYDHLSKVYKKERDARTPTVGNKKGGFMGLLGAIYRDNKLSPAAKAKNYKETGSFVAFMALGALSIAYFVTFKTYHASLMKNENLTALFKNPNARVAAGKKGKKLMKKLQKVDKKEEKKSKKAVKQAVESQDVMTHVKSLIAAKKQQKTVTVV